MNTRTAGQAIRDTVDMEQILALYGYRTKHGFMCCPFHGERAPSLKVYAGSGGWHCFGCGRGGSVIDFVMEHEGCSFPVAVRAIDHHLRLGLFDDHENVFAAEDKKRAQEAFDRFAEACNEYCDRLTVLIEFEQRGRLSHVRALEARRDEDPQSLTADEWTILLSWADDDQYDEYRKEKLKEMKEEVAAWRRRARRTG